MHDLLKEMGRSIESAKVLKKRTRIWDLKDITRVLNKSKGSSMIEAINVNLSRGERTLEFDCSMLSRLDCLNFLEFHADRESKVKFCWERFDGFPEELRYFRWDGYPQKSLPLNFCVENLVELHMPDTAIRELWSGKQNIVNLKVINLKDAKKLMEFPDVSEGRNLEVIILDNCTSLVKLSPSIQHLPKLEHLNLTLCVAVESVPTTFDSKALEVIVLDKCGGIKVFPKVASQGHVVRVLHLEDTNITEVPSLERLTGLEVLSVGGCENLESFPEIMEPMESLWNLCLSGCTKLKKLPNDQSFQNLKSLEKLFLAETAITELPSSIQHLICLKYLNISGCQNLTSLPSSIHNLRSLTTMDASGSGIVDLPESIGQLSEMTNLYLSGCKCLRSLPPSMKQLSQLMYLDLRGCLNLCSLPELPSSLLSLKANGCVLLKTIPSACFASESRTGILGFANCFNWDEEERRRVLDIGCPNLLYMLGQVILSNQEFEIMLPWSEIPEWPCCSQSVGSSLTLKLPVDDQCYIFAFCVVIKPNYTNSIDPEDSHNYNPMNCYIGDDADESRMTSCEFERLSSDDEHLLLWSKPWDLNFRKYFGPEEGSLQFHDNKGEVEVTKCGVLILPIEDILSNAAERYSFLVDVLRRD